MASSKAFLCDFCVIMLLGISMMQAEEKCTRAVVSTCCCGGFPTITPSTNSTPLLCQNAGLTVTCDTEGETTCKNLCNALAQATKAKGPEILCNILANADELKLSAFYKICDKPWVYANLTADEPLCCADNKVKLCASAEKANITTLAVDITKTVM